MENGAERIRSEAERVFYRLLRSLPPGTSPESTELLRSQPEELHQELRRILEDYRFLRAALGGNAGIERIPRELGDFELRRKLGEGGMGEVWEAHQHSLNREVALKLLVRQTPLPSKALERFRREAEAGARLNHPGIVAVYEVGEHEGVPFIAQELVAGGRTLADLIAENQALPFVPENHYRKQAEVIQHAAEALAAGHEAGILHRDVKPGNILLAPGGRPKISDFGLARILGDRTLTLTGENAGTPSYMSPEQAAGHLARVDQRSDIFSLGVTLYETLTLTRPFQGDTAVEIYRKILDLDPPDPRKLRSRIPLDLSVICLKAMEKDPARRYSSMTAFAADLRRFLDHQPILARPPGPFSRARKFQRRHPAIAAGVSVAVLAFAGITGLFFRAVRAETRAVAEKTRVLRLSVAEDLRELKERAAPLWPATPERIKEYQEWLDDADTLRENRVKLQATLEELQSRALPWSPEEQRHDRETHPLAGKLASKKEALKVFRGELSERLDQDPGKLDPHEAASRKGDIDFDRRRIAQLEGEIPHLEALVASRRTWTFPSREEKWWESALRRLVSDLGEFFDPRIGLASGFEPGQGPGIGKRLDLARRAAAVVEDREAVRLWQEAIAAIADEELCPAYHGLRIPAQSGLLPLGKDPQSGLWEFAHAQSGEAPARNPRSGELSLVEESGMVLVLLPGGTFRMGAQDSDPSAPGYDPQAYLDESPVQEIALDPFFLSKYEMTQAQWLRFMDDNPSQLDSDYDLPGYTINLLHPVESVSWEECRKTLERLDLELPTEAQWEYAARAGTSSPWWTGPERETLQGAANLADQSAAKGGAGWPALQDWPGLDDGFPLHAPVDALHPNAFGLHHVTGNVMEWCADGYAKDSYQKEAAPGNGQRVLTNKNSRCVRGGAFNGTAAASRSSKRAGFNKDSHVYFVGVRPSRRIEGLPKRTR
ncbi:MAG: bifunctional serine/threonine-protein kinase/formylglycine-generating enzyme family protein [Planctomycetota bacterium]